MKQLKFTWVILLLSIVGSVVIFFLADPDPHEYHIQYDFTERSETTEIKIFFHDLNGDGLDEKIKTHYNGSNGFIVCQAITAGGGMIDQYNIESDKCGATVPKFGDFDHDGTKEIYIHGIKGNKIFLKQVLPYEEQPHNQLPDIFIDSMLHSIGDPSVNMSNPLFFDLNEDGYDEMYFTLVGQYKTYYPRKMYVVDLKALKKIRESEALGIMPETIRFCDLDKDGRVEISGSTAASANIDSLNMYPIDDRHAWFLTFDLDLNWVAEPTQFSDGYTRFLYTNQIAPYQTQLSGIVYHGGRYGHKPFLFQTSSYSELDTIVYLPGENYYSGVILKNLRYKGDSALVLVSATQGLQFYTPDFELTKSIKFKHEVGVSDREVLPWINQTQDVLSITHDKDTTCSFYAPDGKLLVRHDFKDFTPGIPAVGFTTYFKSGSYYLPASGKILYFHFEKNPWYWGKYLLIPLAFAAVFLVFYILSWVQRRQIAIRQNLMHDMRKLELVGIKNQLDPHFAFNALNVLSYLSSKKDHEGIESFTEHFSKLMRRQLEMSDKPAVTLYDELRFVRHYIELQRLRFDVPIQYDEEVIGSVDMNLKIPKMMIHTHVENAIKHGFLPNQRGGKIKVHISTQKKATQITIIDDGIGFSQNNGNGSTGRGLSILNQLYKLYYQLYKVKIRQEIKRLESPSGTEVVITIPK